MESNGGCLKANHKGKAEGYWNDPWYDKNAIANIIALKNLKTQHRVTYDSASSGNFIVHREAEGLPNIEFKMHSSGLHYYNPREHGGENIFLNLESEKDHQSLFIEEQFESCFISTVAENMKRYSKREIAGAEKAKRLYSGLRLLQRNTLSG